MRVNIYKSEIPDHLILKVSEAPDVSRPLAHFLSNVLAIKSESVTIEGENTIRFIPTTQDKMELHDLNSSLIYTVREMLLLDPDQMMAAFLIVRQQQGVLLQGLEQAQKANIEATTKLVVCRDYINKVESIVGWMAILLIIATTLAIVGIFV